MFIIIRNVLSTNLSTIFLSLQIPEKRLNITITSYFNLFYYCAIRENVPLCESDQTPLTKCCNIFFIVIIIDLSCMIIDLEL